MLDDVFKQYFLLFEQGLVASISGICPDFTSSKRHIPARCFSRVESFAQSFGPYSCFAVKKAFGGIAWMVSFTRLSTSSNRAGGTTWPLLRTTGISDFFDSWFIFFSHSNTSPGRR